MPPLNAPAAADGSAANSGTDFGLDADEMKAFNEMRETPAPSGDAGFTPPDDTGSSGGDAAPGGAPAAGADGAAVGGAAPAAGADAAAAAAAGAGGAVEPDDEGDEPNPPGPDGVAKPPKRVSYSKFKRAMDDAAKNAADLATTRAEKDKLAEQQARLDERLKLINEALQPPPGAAAAEQVDDDPEPDIEKDIFAHHAWLQRQVVKTQNMLNERIGGLEQKQQASTAEQELATAYMDDARVFAGQEPNFGPAYAFLMDVRIKQLAHFHFGKDLTNPNEPPLNDEQVKKIKAEVAREERTLVSQAIKAKKSPAAAVYAMAKMTGFRPAAAAAAAAGGAAPAAAGGAAPAAGAPGTVAAAVAAAEPAAGGAPANGAGKPTVTQQIAAIKAGQDASMTLSQGGGAPAPVLNAQKLANMPQEEFDQLLETMSRDDLRKIMGG